MDNLPKDQDKQNASSGGSGDIFSNTPDTGYAQAAQLTAEGPPETPFGAEIPLAPPETSLDPEHAQSAQAEVSPGNASTPPPPFTQDNRRRMFGVGIALVVILLILIGLFAFVRSRFQKPAAPVNVALTYWGLWEDEAVVKTVIEDYQRLHPNVTVTYKKQDQKQYRERVAAAIDRGEGPDIFRFHNTWLPLLITQLAPVPKSVYSDEEFINKFYPVVTSDLKTGGTYYGVPLMIDGLVMFYNEDILKSANISVPTTWVDMQAASAKLTVKENGRIVTSAVALGTAENIEHFSDILGLMMLQNGTQPVKSLQSCADGGSTCAVEALSFYRKFAETPNNSWDDTLENSIIAFAGGKVAMIFAPSWQAFAIKQLSPDLNFKIAKIPQLPCNQQPCPSVNLANYWVEGVSVKSKNQDAAFAFVKYLSQPDTVRKLYAEQSKIRLFGEPYALVELGKLLADHPYLSPIIAQAPTMKSFYAVAKTFDGDTGINSSLNTYLKDAVNSLGQGGSPETAIKTADNGFKQVFTRFGLSAAQ